MDKIKLTIAGYDKIAHDWHGTRRHTWDEVDNIIKKEITEYFLIKNFTFKILDLGCGNGRLIQTLNKIKESEIYKNLNINYIGIDPSDELIKICKKEYSNLSNVDFEVNDGIHIPSKDESIDIVVSLAVLHHVPPEYQDVWLTEVHRVLKKISGKVIISVWLRDDSNDHRTTVHQRENKDEMLLGFAQHKNIRYVYLFTENELVNLFERNNFKVLERKIEQRPNSKNKNIILVAEPM